MSDSYRFGILLFSAYSALEVCVRAVCAFDVCMCERVMCVCVLCVCVCVCELDLMHILLY